MTNPYIDLINGIGVTLILLAFFLLQTGKLASTAKAYLLLNLVGSALACLGSYLMGSWPFVVLEGVWAAVSLFGLLKPNNQLGTQDQ